MPLVRETSSSFWPLTGGSCAPCSNQQAGLQLNGTHCWSTKTSMAINMLVHDAVKFTVPGRPRLHSDAAMPWVLSEPALKHHAWMPACL
jgi:hypothetical protein